MIAFLHLVVNPKSKSLAARYGFSPRLYGLMCSDPQRPQSRSFRADGDLPSMHSSMQPHKDARFQAEDDHSSDLEGGIELTTSSPSTLDHLDLNHYTLVNEVWHFCSVDWGAKCEEPMPLIEKDSNMAKIFALAIIRFMIYIGNRIF